MTRADLAALLREAQMWNVSAHVTGLLLHIDDCFLQYLEAPEPALRNLAERLLIDTRHADIGWIFFEPAGSRLLSDQALAFSDWSSPMPLEKSMQLQLQAMLTGELTLSPGADGLITSRDSQLDFWRRCIEALPQ